MQLYQFQTEYLTGLPPKYIFAADTGTGKTVMALAHYANHARFFEAEQLKEGGDWRNKADYEKIVRQLPLLILAPAAKANTGDWQREITEYFGAGNEPEYEIYSYEKFSRVPTLKQYRENGDRGVWRDWLTRHPSGFAIIADEVHRAKNPQSGIGKRLYDVASHASFFVGLSATPIPNGWIDAANYFKIFGFTKNITAFKNRYCDIQTFKGFPEIRGYFHEAELKGNWDRIAKPLPKEQALDLPTLTSVPVTLSAGGDYLKLLKERLVGDKFLDNPSALLHALRQSVVGPKVVWLQNFLEGVSDNVVIFYNYKSERDLILEMIKKHYKGRTVFRQDGKKHEVPTKMGWGNLQRTITLAQYQSGSTGIELTYAATTVYFSPTYSYSNYEQSIGRINRHGQTRKMTLYLLCSPTTIEKDIWGALRNKRDFQITQWLADKRKAVENEKLA